MPTLSELFAIIGFVALLAMVIIDFYLQYLAAQTGRKRAIITRFTIALVAAIVTFGGSCSSNKQRSRDEQAQREHRERLEAKLAESVNVQTQLKVQLDATKKEYDKILLAVTTNSASNPSLLAALAQKKGHFCIPRTDNIDIGSFVSELNERRDLSVLNKKRNHLKAIEDEKILFAPNLKMSDYNVRAFITALDKISGASLSTDFTSMPSLDTICTGPNDKISEYDNVVVPIADVKVGTNLLWKCYILRKNNTMQGYDNNFPLLIIARQQTGASTNVLVTRFTADLNIPERLIEEPITTENYKNAVDTALRGLIAVDSEALSMFSPNVNH